MARYSLSPVAVIVIDLLNIIVITIDQQIQHYSNLQRIFIM